MKANRRRLIVWRLRLVFQITLFTLVCLAVAVFVGRSFSPLPSTPETRRENLLRRLEGLALTMHEERGAERMQKVFPEGACFTLTLYGLAWTNAAQCFPEDEALRRRAVEEALWAYAQYERDVVSGFFTQTQVDMGVFFLGQKNLLAAQLLETAPDEERLDEVEADFHAQSRELAEAFLASPTKHLDSYPGMAWPADNVTALVSLLIHDELYGTNYREAYDAWKEWTRTHCDPATGLPAGHLDARTGRLLQPARGCANSWMLGLLARRDPPLAQAWAERNAEHFIIKRLGFRMVREYPEGHDGRADIDSGPILFGAGVTATGVGLGSSLALGDMKTAADVHALAQMFGLPGDVEHQGAPGRRSLLGLLPVGDAFLAWGYSLPPPAPPPAPPGFFARLQSRAVFYLAALVVAGLLALRAWLLVRWVRKKRREQRAGDAERGEEAAAEAPEAL